LSDSESTCSIVACPQVTRSSKRKTHKWLLRNDRGVGDTLETVLTEPIPVRHLHRKERQAVERLFEIDFGAKKVRSFLLPVARMSKIFLSPIRRFPQKNFWSWRESSPAQSH
jgi:hypothetical protein